MAEYCHNSCSKCPPFAHAHATRHSIFNDGLVNAKPKMQQKLLQFTILIYIKWSAIYKKIFNRNLKLKQQLIS